jgi:chemotaxis protein methyltransferase CheR
MIDWNERRHRRFSDLISARTGLVFDDRRGDLLRRGVRAGAELAGEQDLDRYIENLRSTPTSSALWDDLVGEITIGETYFFRNTGHFDALRETIFPDLMTRHRGDRRIRIWSAACSTGEEPYSLAMLMHGMIPDLSAWNLSILGTDISKRSLDRAREGSYREWSFRRTEKPIRDAYFRAGDYESKLVHEIRGMVQFRYLNQKEDPYPSLDTNTHALDLILCRNLAIYLPEDVIRTIADRFYECLVPGGWLIVGASETNSEIFDRYETISLPGTIIYRKPARAEVTEPPPASPPPVDQPAGRVRTRQRRPRFTPGSTPEVTTAEVSVEALCREARRLAKSGESEAAISCCDRAIAQEPLAFPPYYVRALLHLGEGDVEASRDDLRKTLYLEPDFILGHFALANLYDQEMKEEDAMRHRTKAVRLVSRMAPDQILSGSETITAERLLAILQATATAER